MSDLLVHPRIREIVEREIEERNRLLADHEIIRRFAILLAQSPMDSGEWKASLRLNRQDVLERNRDLVEAFYEGSLS